MNIYAVKDLVEKQFYTIFMDFTDDSAVRNNLPYLTRVRPISDLALYRIGTFDVQSAKIEPCFEEVTLDCYHFDEQVMQDMGKSVAQRELEEFVLKRKIALATRQAELEKAQLALEQQRRRGDVPQDPTM